MSFVLFNSMRARISSSESLLKQVSDLKGSLPLVINFWADWCKPCVQLNSVFDKLAQVCPHLSVCNVLTSLCEVLLRFLFVC